MRWETKEWYPHERLVMYWLRSDLFGFSLQFNKYRFDLQIGWFGLTIE